MFKNNDKVYMTQYGKISESKKHKGEIFTVVGEPYSIGGEYCVFLKEFNKPYYCCELRTYKENNNESYHMTL